MSWSRLEVEATVSDYFHMLVQELAGQSYWASPIIYLAIFGHNLHKSKKLGIRMQESNGLLIGLLEYIEQVEKLKRKPERWP